MTSHELARKLLEGPDLMVTVRGYEYGVDEIRKINPPEILCVNVNSSGVAGDHDLYVNCNGDTDHDHIRAIHLERD